MTLAVHVATEGVRIPLARARVADVVREVLRAEHVGEAMVSVAFVTAPTIAALNRGHLGHSGPTDVIAFRLNGETRRGILGDIYIAPAVARRNAAAHGSAVREELLRLVVHGTLHVLGYDHPGGEGRTTSRMWKKQERFVGRAAARWRARS